MTNNQLSSTNCTSQDTSFRMPEDESCRRYDFFVQFMAGEDQNNRGLATYPMCKSCCGIQKVIFRYAIASLAANRCAWRKFVVICSTIDLMMMMMMMMTMMMMMMMMMKQNVDILRPKTRGRRKIMWPKLWKIFLQVNHEGFHVFDPLFVFSC